MKYPVWLPYPRSLLRAAIVLAGILGWSFVVAQVAKVLNEIFAVLTWLNFLVSPLSIAFLLILISLFLWGMAWLHQIESDRPLKLIPHWRSWFGGIADLLIASVGLIAASATLSHHAPPWFVLFTIWLASSYIYYLFALFAEGRQLERSRQEAQRKERNRQANRKLPKIKRPKSSKPHDPIETELAEMRRKLEE
jgi:hypothetical protein